jgi:hypothetical protein
MTKKIKPSELEAEAKKLIDSEQMPSLETLLTVIAEVRVRYGDQILSVRHPKRGKR